MNLNKTEYISNFIPAQIALQSFTAILTNILYYGIPVYAIFRTIQQSSITYISYLFSFLIAFILFLIINKKNLNQRYKLLVVTSIWLSIIGRIYLYDNFQFYDKILHFITPFIITCITYDFLSRTSCPSNKLYAFLIVATLLSLFEVFEYILDFCQFFEFNTCGVYDEFGNQLMSPAKDTVIDLILGLFAALTALILRFLPKDLGNQI